MPKNRTTDFSKMEDIFCDEILLNIFSFFSPQILLKMRRVCKTWERIANDDYLWKQFIKNSFLDRLHSSDLSAFGFYQNNLEARKYTYYCIGQCIQVSQPNNFSNLIELDEKQLLAGLNIDESENLHLFSTLESAIKCADNVAEADEINCEKITGIYRYPPIFTIRIKANVKLEETNKCVITVGCAGETTGKYRCFKLKKVEIAYVYNAFYKTGIINQKTENHNVNIKLSFKEQQQQNRSNHACILS